MMVSNYDQIAQCYDESIRSSSLIHELLGPGLFDLFGNIEGQHICDLACGQGPTALLVRCRKG
jgi:ubiquinone/menaquinone biosynthesis C-methylase UbiE